MQIKQFVTVFVTTTTTTTAATNTTTTTTTTYYYYYDYDCQKITKYLVYLNNKDNDYSETVFCYMKESTFYE